MESSDPLAETFLVDEDIMEIMSLEEPPWIDTHQRSSFLPNPAIMPTAFEESSSPFLPPTITHEVWLEGNLGNITETVSIDISIKLGVVITISPFAKWGIDYMTCKPRSTGQHGYIIIAMDYFTKWVEVMPTYSENGKTAAQFLFNHVISRFGVPQAIVRDHGSHFRDYMMAELTSALGLRHNGLTLYYSQANDQVEAVNKSNWHLMLFSALWAYRTSTKDATSFTPFHLFYGLEATLPIECEIPSLRLVVELLPETSPQEEHLLYLERLDETRRLVALVIEAQKEQR